MRRRGRPDRCPAASAHRECQPEPDPRAWSARHPDGDPRTTIEDRGRPAVHAGDDRQHQAGSEERRPPEWPVVRDRLLVVLRLVIEPPPLPMPRPPAPRNAAAEQVRSPPERRADGRRYPTACVRQKPVMFTEPGRCVTPPYKECGRVDFTTGGENTTLSRSGLSRCNAEEINGDQAGAADQHAVDVRDGINSLALAALTEPP